jgi:hypothetical protein
MAVTESVVPPPRNGRRKSVPTRLVAAREGEEVVAPEERLQEHVVEGEGHRGGENDQRALGGRERQLAARAEEDDDGDTREGGGEARGPAQAPTLEPDAHGEEKRQRGGEGDHEGRGPDVVYLVPTFREMW